MKYNIMPQHYFCHADIIFWWWVARARGLIKMDRYFVHTGIWMGTYVRAARPWSSREQTHGTSYELRIDRLGYELLLHIHLAQNQSPEFRSEWRTKTTIHRPPPSTTDCQATSSFILLFIERSQGKNCFPPRWTSLLYPKTAITRLLDLFWT